MHFHTDFLQQFSGIVHSPISVLVSIYSTCTLLENYNRCCKVKVLTFALRRQRTTSELPVEAAKCSGVTLQLSTSVKRNIPVSHRYCVAILRKKKKERRTYNTIFEHAVYTKTKLQFISFQCNRPSYLHASTTDCMMKRRFPLLIYCV